MKRKNLTSSIIKTAILLLGMGAFSLPGFSQNEKCLYFSRDLIKDIKGKIICEYVDADDTTLYGLRVEVPQNFTLEIIKSACDTLNKNLKVISDWKINYDKNYEKKIKVYGKNVLITFYPNDKMLYFDFPRY